jgi:hypothetical protein
MDETARLARNALAGEEAIRTGGIAADEKIAAKALDVQRTTEASNARLDAKVIESVQQSMTNQGRDLNAAERRALDTQLALMSRADKMALIKSNENITRYNAESQRILQLSRNAVALETARLTAKARAATNATQREEVMADLTKAIATAQGKRSSNLSDLVVANVANMGRLKPEQKKAYLVGLKKLVNEQIELAIKPLQTLLNQMQSGVKRTGKPTSGKKYGEVGK